MLPTRDDVLSNLEVIRVAVREACGRADRDPADVMLVAAAKGVSAQSVSWVVDAGVTAVGANYVSELRAQHERVLGARWHFIGTLQRSTAHHVASLADVVQTVTGGRATERLARRANEAGRTVDAMIEVDFTGERSGVPPDEVMVVAERTGGLDGLRLVGLMTVPPITSSADEARPWFVRLRRLQERVRADHPRVLELSMGMSLDYQVAVEEGATMVRVGTALFGPRAPLT
jgi:pyridoxal phosphate enzyme (YggS family)